jgi:SulP family sulfate permease
MSDTTTVTVCKTLLEENAHESPAAFDSDLILRKDVPKETALFEITGPFFFAVSDLLNEQWKELTSIPKVFILRMRKVSTIDTSGIKALKEFTEQLRQKKVVFLLSGVQEELRPLFASTGLNETIGDDRIFPHLDAALAYANKIVIATK